MISASQKKEVIDDFRGFVDDIGGWAKNYWHHVSGQEKKELAQRFFEWSQKNLTDVGLRVWINNLSDEGLEVLTDLLSCFCRNFDIDLAWLVDGRLSDEPALKQGIMQVVSYYCSACKLALGQQDAVQKFRRLDYYYQPEDKDVR